MGKHILKCECGEEHDISELFGSVVKEWVESNAPPLKDKIGSNIVKNVISHELDIWKDAHQESKKVLDKFANKLIFELKYRVKDPTCVKGASDE